MNGADAKGELEYDVLMKFGGKWAVLMSMSVAMARKGIALPPDLNDKLASSRMKIRSGCFSCCEIGCALAEVESRLSSQFHMLDEQEFMKWSELLGDAMQGKLNSARIIATPELAPLKNDSDFLKCTC